MSTSIQNCLFVPAIEYFKFFLFYIVIKALNQVFNISIFSTFISFLMEKPKQKTNMLMEKPKQKPNMLNIFNAILPLMSELLSDKEPKATTSRKEIPSTTIELKKTIHVDNIIATNS